MKSSREQFEEWFNERSNWKITPSMRKKDGYVGNPSAQSKWDVWHASRAEIEITLPDCDDYQTTWQYQDAAEIKIKELGLTVK